MVDIAQLESRLEACMKENDTAEAIRIISELAITFAGEKQFEKAEYYRDMLYKVDEMALSDIIRVNEAIEKEKTEGIDVAHKQIFSSLYEQLSPSQASTLYYALTEMSVDTGKIVEKQGDPGYGLFFVDSGKLSVGYRRDDINIFLGYLEPGTFFSEDTFFSNSISTVSVTAFSPATLRKLGRDVFKSIRKEHPGLQKILHNYCLKGDTVSNRLKEKGLDRRNLKRERLSGNALIQMLDSHDNLIGRPIRIELHDISPGGSSFILRIPDDEKAALMLGRKLVIQFTSKETPHSVKIQKMGTIVAISPGSFEDYSFHVKFDTELLPHFLDTILSVFKIQT